jgi:hypothetical protein
VGEEGAVRVHGGHLQPQSDGVLEHHQLRCSVDGEDATRHHIGRHLPGEVGLEQGPASASPSNHQHLVTEGAGGRGAATART